MHLVSSDRIVLVPHDPRPGYRFRVASLPADVRSVDLADACAAELDGIREAGLRNKAWSSEREYEEFLEARARLPAGAVIASVSSARVVAEARRHYAELGYYRAEINRIELPEDAPYRLAVRVEHLLYSLKDARRFGPARDMAPPLRDAGESLALARAVNFGVVPFVVLPDDDALAARYMGELLAREIVPLAYLAGILVRNSPLSAASGTLEILS